MYDFIPEVQLCVIDLKPNHVTIALLLLYMCNFDREMKISESV